MTLLTVTLIIDCDDEAAFWARFDEDRVARSLPAWHAWLGDGHAFPALEFHAEAHSASAFRDDFDGLEVAGALPPGARVRLAGVVERVSLVRRIGAAVRRTFGR